MSDLDNMAKRLLAKPTVFASIFNYLFWCLGINLRMLADRQEERDSALAISLPDALSPTGHRRRRTLTRLNDLVKDVVLVDDKGEYQITAFLEAQSFIRYNQAQQSSLYCALRKEKNMGEIRGKYRRKSTDTADEYLSRMRRTDRLNVVIGCTVYFGIDLWDAKLNTDELLIYNHPDLQKVIDHCPVNLVSLCEITEQGINILDPELRPIAFVLSHANDLDKLEQYIREEPLFRNMSEESYILLQLCTNLKLPQEIHQGQHSQEEKYNMFTAWNQLIERERKKERAIVETEAARNIARVETEAARNIARVETEAARNIAKEREKAEKNNQKIAQERDIATQERDIATQERDIATQERDKTKQEKDNICLQFVYYLQEQKYTEDMIMKTMRISRDELKHLLGMLEHQKDTIFPTL